MDIREKLKSGFVFCDGGTGTALQTQGLGAMEQYRLYRRIEMLTGMQRELRATARVLERYYEGADRHARLQ